MMIPPRALALSACQTRRDDRSAFRQAKMPWSRRCQMHAQMQIRSRSRPLCLAPARAPNLHLKLSMQRG